MKMLIKYLLDFEHFVRTTARNQIKINHSMRQGEREIKRERERER